jgi:hypothetical protein
MVLGSGLIRFSEDFEGVSGGRDGFRRIFIAERQEALSKACEVPESDGWLIGEGVSAA